MLSDQGELPDVAGRESPPAGEALQVPEPSRSVAVLLDEFGRWLERWAGYARARAAQIAGSAEKKPDAPDELSPAGFSQPAQGPPAHWQAAVTQGPPAHWLALFDGQPADQPEVSPASPSQAPAASPDEIIHQFQAELADFLSPHPPHPAASESPPTTSSKAGSVMGAVPMGKPLAKTFPPADQGSTQPEPGSPMETPLPTSTTVEPAPGPPGSSPAPARVTRLRLPTAPHPATLIPSPGSPPESQPAGNDLLPPGSSLETPQPSQSPPGRLADVEASAAQTRVTRLRLNRSHQAGPIDLRQPASLPISPHPASPLPEPPTAPAPISTWAAVHPHPAPGPEAAPALQPPPQDASPHVPTPLSPQDGHVSPTAADNPLPPPPAWAELPAPAEALPILWPTATNQAHWPALPDPLPPHTSSPSPFQNPARRSRLDREQGGSPWNG